MGQYDLFIDYVALPAVAFPLVDYGTDRSVTLPVRRRKGQGMRIEGKNSVVFSLKYIVDLIISGYSHPGIAGLRPD